MKTPTNTQILETLNGWKETLHDSYLIRVGKHKGKLPPEIKQEIACIDAAAAQISQPGWIPVSQEMPDSETSVLIHTVDPEWSEPVWIGYFDCGDESMPATWRLASAERVTHVTHWRHLPEPPRL